MNYNRTATFVWSALSLVGALAPRAMDAADIIVDGRAAGAVWHLAGDGKPAGRRVPTESIAAKDLAAFLERMSGVRLEVRAVEEEEKPPRDQPAIVLGNLAFRMGLPKPPTTPSGDAYRIQTQGNHLLMAGECPRSTGYAVTHFLGTLGCRWLVPNQWGELVPERKTVSLAGLDVTEKPDFLFREVWGWFPRSRGRMGGMDLPNRHDWAHVPAKDYFEKHPDYFALRNGERRPGGWVCTSHPDVPRLFADAYLAKAREGFKADTISPPDGRGFCQCEKCQAQDVPDYIEPSSGTISMSDRYVRFFDAVGQLVKKGAPNFILSFYCYSDYTLPPKRVHKVSDNLCGWVTTIRFCRLHGVDNPRCESRQRYRQVVLGWSKLMQTACYEYNYNLAEVTVPISKISAFKANIPFLKQTGCLGINLESMAAWNLYGPHTYLASRLMWHADADADAILDEYYEKLCGKAAPHVKSYWERVDRACREADVHVGCFYGVHAIWTPELVRQCTADLEAAAQVIEAEREQQNVAMFRSGLDNVNHYLALRAAINRCDFAAAKKGYDAWLAHFEHCFERKFNTMSGYRYGYVKWFLRPAIEGGLARTTGGCRLVQQLPDEWLFRYDREDAGEKGGWFRDKVEAEGWRRVRTYSASLNEQKLPEQLTWMWYRARFTTPKKLPEGPLHLWFGEVDGSPTRVWLNGKCLGEFEGSRRPSELEVTGKLHAGRENLVVIKTGHHGISELMLGGILKPVMIYSGTPPEPEK